MRFSVVICTVDRADSLEATLDALRLQAHGDFEVVVVAGPSGDGTDALLAARADELRIVRHTAAHLSQARNLGIDAAAGDVVAFLDDDAIPEPRWLANLAVAYGDDALAGAGGFVRGPNGVWFQYRWSLCTRLGAATTQAGDPGPGAVTPGADPFLYLQGTNASFRREALAAAGGFDEEIEFFHDETDLCARLIDAGRRLRVVPGADVIHRFRPSARRDVHGRVRDAYSIVKNQAYFALRHAGDHAAVDAGLERFCDDWRGQARSLAERGLVEPADRDRMLERIDAGLRAGRAAGERGEPRTRELAAPDPAAFLPYPTAAAGPERRRVVFVSSEYPPADFGGVGRFTQDLARGFARLGWESHVIVPGGESEADPLLADNPEAQARARRLDAVGLEDGAWVHRAALRGRAPRLDGLPVQAPLDRAATARHALAELEARFGPADIVSAPLWNADGLVVSLDPRRPTVTTLMTTLRTVVDMHPSWPRTDVVRLLDLEREALRHAGHLHAISDAILASVRHDYPAETAHAQSHVLHLGVRDRRAAHPRRRDPADGRTRLLFVGRLERRKGVDTLLAAAADVLRRRPEAELVLVGRDTLNTEIGRTYREAFAERHAAEPGLLERVTFAGAVDEDALYAHYADADVFVAPSRYESFGLVHVEAMMMGLPVVACGIGGMAEVVSDGVTGTLVPPGDAPALAAALDALVTDAERRRAYGAAGRARYERRFTDVLAAERTAAAYAEIAATAGDGREAAPGEVERRLADTIERVAGVPATIAREIAEGLLDPAGDHPLAAVRRAWGAPPAVLVTELYRALLGREPDEAGLARFVAELEAGRPRGEVVRDIGWSEESRAAGRDLDWLGDLLELDGWTEELACAAAFAQPSDARFVQDLADLLVVDGPAREQARGQLSASLAAGHGRLRAARHLIGGGNPPFRLRGAPDFAGWEPMLNHFSQGGPPAARRDVRASALAAARRGRSRLIRARLARSAGATAAVVATTDRRTVEIAEAIGRLEAQLRDLAHDEVATRGDLAGRIAQLSELAGRTHEAAQRSLEHVTQALEHTGGGLDANAARVDILQRKLEAMAIDLRDRLPSRPGPAELPEPSIPDPDAYARRLAELAGDLRVNLGAGEKPVPGYINADMRPLQGVDVVADVRRLPFDPGSLAEVMSAHLVEHFREHQLEVVLLPYWRSLLRPDGTLRIICPNWEAMTARLADGRMTWAEFKVLTFGLQDYDGDDHFAMYTPDSLRRVLERAGFATVEVLVEDRMNGMCPEMELVARPGAREQLAAAPASATGPSD